MLSTRAPPTDPPPTAQLAPQPTLTTAECVQSRLRLSRPLLAVARRDGSLSRRGSRNRACSSKATQLRDGLWERGTRPSLPPGARSTRPDAAGFAAGFGGGSRGFFDPAAGAAGFGRYFFFGHDFFFGRRFDVFGFDAAFFAFEFFAARGGFAAACRGRQAGFVAAVFETVDRRLRLKFFDRGARFLAGFFHRRDVFAFGRQFQFALDLGQLFRRFHEFGVAAVVFGRRAEALEAFDHAEVEVGDFFALRRGPGFFGFRGAEGADGRVDLGADPVALLDQFVLGQRRRFFDGRRRRFGFVAATAAAARDGERGKRRDQQEQGLVAGSPHEGEASKGIRRLCRGLGKLRPRGSNPDFLVQSEACCHYTRPQRRPFRIRDQAERGSPTRRRGCPRRFSAALRRVLRSGRR